MFSAVPNFILNYVKTERHMMLAYDALLLKMISRKQRTNSISDYQQHFKNLSAGNRDFNPS